MPRLVDGGHTKKPQEILENADEKLTARMRRLLDFLWLEWKHLQLQIESLSKDLEKIASSDELQSAPADPWGLGSVNAPSGRTIRTQARSRS